MNEKEKKAIEVLSGWYNYNKKNRNKLLEADKIINVQETILNLIEKQQKELEKKDKMIESVKDRIEYYLMGNSTLNDFNVREKELERLLKVLNKAEESE